MMPFGSQGYEPTSLYGPINAKYIRTVSAPSSLTILSGSTTLPRLLLIFCPSGPKMSPRFILTKYGSSQETSPRSFMAFIQNLEYNKCMVVCSAPPEYLATGIHFFIFARDAKTFLFFGSVYRKKYHDESTNVSMVSVSRSAEPPHFGHFAFIHFSALASGDLPSLRGR